MDGFNSPDGKMHKDDRRNLIIFGVLSILVWFGYNHFILEPKLELQREARQMATTRPSLASVKGAEVIRPRDVVIADGKRLPFKNAEISGSINLKGARIDDASLNHHFKTLEKVEHVHLLTPSGAPYARYVEMGWLPGSDDASEDFPQSDTMWSVEGNVKELNADQSVTLVWDNKKGLKFKRVISLDNDSLFQVKQTVINNSKEEITLYPYVSVTQRGVSEDFAKQTTVHEGPMGYIGDKLEEVTYKKLREEKNDTFTSNHGWVALTDKYWLTALLPEQTDAKTFNFTYEPSAYIDQQGLYQVDYIGLVRVAKPSEEVTFQHSVFSGAKEIDSLQKYEKELGVKHFDLAVDFGMWYILTKPLYYTLKFLYAHLGNMGLAIIALTFFVRMLVFPLVNVSYRSFAKMKKIAPEMRDIRDKYENDKVMMQQEIMTLYQREKVNPMAGCLPMLVQIPIFFALFKTFSLTIEMRHAPFFGWIKDLSAPDPTTIFNLFGLLQFTPPSFLMIGAWPLMMLFFMLLQQSLNPPVQDKIQARVFAIMPYFMCYILAGFSAGLVVYWTFSNAISFLQQLFIMRSMGVKVHLFHKPEAEEEIKKDIEEGGPAVHPQIAMVEEVVEEALGLEQKTVTPPKKKNKNQKKKK
jgi:YidC/Oxa1 family membrane protein insertase